MTLNFGSAVVVSLQAVGTFLTMLLAGFLLRKAGRFSDELSKGLAQIGVNVAIPCLLFTSMVNCEQDYSDDPCPQLADSIRNGWPLFLWPIAVVSMGLFLAKIIVHPFGNVPPSFRKTSAVASAFGNSTGLIITLLAAIHKSYNPQTDPLGIVDPTQYLAVYLLLYPLLQWTLGGYLIGIYKPRQEATPRAEQPPVAGPSHDGPASDPAAAVDKSSALTAPESAPAAAPVGPGVSTQETSLADHQGSHDNISRAQQEQQQHDTDSSPKSRRGQYEPIPRGDDDEEQHSQTRRHSPQVDAQGDSMALAPLRRHNSSSSLLSLSRTHATNTSARAPSPRSIEVDDDDVPLCSAENGIVQVPATSSSSTTHTSSSSSSATTSAAKTAAPADPGPVSKDALPEKESAFTIIRQQVLQPPTIAILVGALIGLTPIRGIFVDIVDRENDAPLQFMFNGMRNLGQAAVPINMFIMGASLAKSVNWREISWRTNLLIALVKLVLMPMFGFLCTYVLIKIFPIDKVHAPAFYLVMVMVTCTPTANNIMVMTELAGENKQMLSTCMFMQYVLTPFLMTVSVILAVSLATSIA